MKKIITTEKTFTFIELMMMMALVGILSIIAVPTFHGYKGRARQTEAKVGLSSIYVAERAFNVEYNSYVANLKAIGFSATPKNYILGFGKENKQEIGTAITGLEAMQLSGTIGKPGDAKAMGCIGNTLDVNYIAKQATFIAGAVGNIGNMACDKWSINEKRDLKAVP